MCFDVLALDQEDEGERDGRSACSDDFMARWSKRRGLQDGIHLDTLRAFRDNRDGRNVWHEVARDHDAGTDMCEWIKSRGWLDMIDLRDNHGWTPLSHSVRGAHGDRQEAVTKWMVANGADVNAVDDHNTSVFSNACSASSAHSVCH